MAHLKPPKKVTIGHLHIKRLDGHRSFEDQKSARSN